MPHFIRGCKVEQWASSHSCIDQVPSYIADEGMHWLNLLTGNNYRIKNTHTFWRRNCTSRNLSNTSFGKCLRQTCKVNHTASQEWRMGNHLLIGNWLKKLPRIHKREWHHALSERVRQLCICWCVFLIHLGEHRKARCRWAESLVSVYFTRMSLERHAGNLIQDSSLERRLSASWMAIRGEHIVYL